ncbi:DUF6249 domain-containing protein [Hymenobacter sp. BT559]|uniref:DUF6249 domain-containing protein n=1 Tax=Hymenobacter sp. BT559 TaxID=2795729 RepID=UPI0018EAC659|nr:DUF6249 domain-containing protein [Hymenobacter sp. BT559]MBJ6142215.1 hypothetical protein [Hymenobacter sp. BT559]
MDHSLEALVPVTIPLTISLCLAGFGIAYYYFTTRSRERLALIEKGLDPTAFVRSRSYLPLLLLLGVLSLGLAAGIAGGAVLTQLVGEHNYVYPATVFFGAGLSLVAAYYLLRATTTR